MPDKMSTRLFNLKIIKYMWKQLYNGYGENRVKGYENDKGSFYSTFEISKEGFRQIELFINSTNENRIMKHAKRIEGKTGISSKYLTGEEGITYSKSRFADKLFNDFDKYIDNRDILKEFCSLKNNKINMSFSPDKIEKLIRRIGTCEGIEDFEEKKEMVLWVLEYNRRLMEYANELLREENPKAFDNIDLYRIVYFIKNKKRYDDVAVLTFNDMDINIGMEDKRTSVNCT